MCNSGKEMGVEIVMREIEWDWANVTKFQYRGAQQFLPGLSRNSGPTVAHSFGN